MSDPNSTYRAPAPGTLSSKPITQFDSGAVRDTQDGKPNFLECFSPVAMWEYGMYMKGVSKRYPPDNWKRGIPQESALVSAERHLLQLKMETEYGVPPDGTDHAAALMFNVMVYLHERGIASGRFKVVRPGPTDKGAVVVGYPRFWEDGSTILVAESATDKGVTLSGEPGRPKISTEMRGDPDSEIAVEYAARMGRRELTRAEAEKLFGQPIIVP